MLTVLLSPVTLTLLVTQERCKGESSVSQREALKLSVSQPFLTRPQLKKPPLSKPPTLPLSSADMVAMVDPGPVVDPAEATVADAPVMEVLADPSSASPSRDLATAVPASAVPATAAPAIAAKATAHQATVALAVLATADLAFQATKFLNVVALAVASSALAVLVTLPKDMAAPTEPAHGEKIVGKTTFQQLEVENSCQV